MQKNEIEEIKWNYTDALFLKSIQVAATDDNSGCDFRELIEIADGINHSVFSVENLKSSLEKLLAVNFVKIKKNKLSLTNSFYQKNSEKTEPTILADTHRLEKLLKTIPLQKNKIQKVDNFTSEQIKNARSKYIKNSLN